MPMMAVLPPGSLRVRQCHAPIADMGRLLASERTQPLFRQGEHHSRPLIQTSRDGLLKSSPSLLFFLGRNLGEMLNLLMGHRGQYQAPIRRHPFKQIRPKPIIGGIDPIDILTGEALPDPLLYILEKLFVLRDQAKIIGQSFRWEEHAPTEER